MADSFPKAIKIWKENMNYSYFPQEKEHVHAKYESK